MLESVLKVDDTKFLILPLKTVTNTWKCFEFHELRSKDDALPLLTVIDCGLMGKLTYVIKPC